MNKKILYLILTVLLIIALYNLLDWLVCLVLPNHEYVFSVNSILNPAIVGAVVSILTIFRKSKTDDDNKNENDRSGE